MDKYSVKSNNVKEKTTQYGLMQQVYRNQINRLKIRTIKIIVIIG